MQQRFHKIEALILQLDGHQQRAVLDYADFMAQGYKLAGSGAGNLKLEAVSRLDKESVIDAIKRLNRMYSMLDIDRLLSETAVLYQNSIRELS